MFHAQKQEDDRTIAYRKQGLTEEITKIEKVWRLINFMSCVHETNEVRKLVWHPIVGNLTRYMVYSDSFSAGQHHPPFDGDFRLLSKLLKCITFVQDMNQCTKMSEILGDKAKYVVNEVLGKPIFTGSAEEGLALFGNEHLDQQKNYDQLDCKLLHDIDIMYESHKMVAYEIDSFLQPLDASGILHVLMRPGKKAGYVTLQKYLPRLIATEIKYVEVVKVCPMLKEYVDQECVPMYVPALAFLVASENDVLPQDCSCEFTYTDGGLDRNRYGDLCEDCKRLSLREIRRGKGIQPTKIWSDTVMIKGPAIHENAIIENDSDPMSATAPLNEIERQERCKLYEKEYAVKRTYTVLPTAKPELGDLFSSSERKMIYIDHVPAVKCVKWPSAAWEFTVRERPSGWPPKSVIQEIVAKGCHVVPRSTKPPPDTKMRQTFHSLINTPHYVDWRLSFSLAEKNLASALNTAQVKCYTLLKILNDKAIDDLRRSRDEKVYESFHVKPFDLDSYFLKTTFFWVCEEIPLDEWKDDNLGACFFKVVEKLILLLEKGTIPNYFLPSSNLIVPNSEINPEFMLKKDAHELAFYLRMFRAKTSNEIFEFLHKCVWNELWEGSEIKPPGCTPQELTMVMEALREENQERWEELQRNQKKEQASTHSISEDADLSKLKNDVGDEEIPNADHNYGSENVATTSPPSIDTGANIESKCIISTEEIQASSESIDDQCSQSVDTRADAIQKMPKSDVVLAQIFAAISKFLYKNGNIHGKGFNTARAAFYEDEAKKLLPEGCSLDDLPEYKLPVTSASSSDSEYDMSDTEYEEYEDEGPSPNIEPT